MDEAARSCSGLELLAIQRGYFGYVGKPSKKRIDLDYLELVNQAMYVQMEATGRVATSVRTFFDGSDTQLVRLGHSDVKSMQELLVSLPGFLDSISMYALRTADYVNHWNINSPDLMEAARVIKKAARNL